MSSEDKEKFEKLNAIVKDKVVKIEAVNVGKLKPSKVLSDLKEQTGIQLKHSDHKQLLCIFKIRPYIEFNGKYFDPFETNTTYCHYDEVHKDYLYQDSWTQFLINVISNNLLTKEQWKESFDKKQLLDIDSYEI